MNALPHPNVDRLIRDRSPASPRVDRAAVGRAGGAERPVGLGSASASSTICGGPPKPVKARMDTRGDAALRSAAASSGPVNRTGGDRRQAAEKEIAVLGCVTRNLLVDLDGRERKRQGVQLSQGDRLLRSAAGAPVWYVSSDDCAQKRAMSVCTGVRSVLLTRRARESRSAISSPVSADVSATGGGPGSSRRSTR